MPRTQLRKLIEMKESWLIAAMPLILYTGLFWQEAGYNSVFGVPWDYIRLDFTQIGRTLYFAMVMFTINLIVVSLVVWLGRLKGNGRERKLGVSSLILFNFEMAVAMQFYVMYGWLVFVGFVLVYVVSVLALFRWAFKERQKKRSRRGRSALGYIVGRDMALKSLIVGLFLSVTPLLMYELGVLRAVMTNEFLVIESTPQCVVVNLYGDSLVCGRLVKEGEPRLSKEFWILDPRTSQNTGQIRTLGRLSQKQQE